jgi:hypothetical protein
MTQSPRASAGSMTCARCSRRGEHQQGFGFQVHLVMQHQFAQALAQGGAARLAGGDHGQAALRAALGDEGIWVDLPAPSMPSKVMNLPDAMKVSLLNESCRQRW